MRDAKIDTLYEGTTAIQGQDFFFRKIVKDQGRALGHVATEIGAFVASEAGNGRLKVERGLLATALDDANALVGHMINDLMSADPNAEGGDLRNVYKVGLNTSRLLMVLGDVVCAWLLLRQADVALAALGGDVSAKDRAFYEGKVAAAKFFATTVLPKVSAERAVAESVDLDLMDSTRPASDAGAPRRPRALRPGPSSFPEPFVRRDDDRVRIRAPMAPQDRAAVPAPPRDTAGSGRPSAGGRRPEDRGGEVVEERGVDAPALPVQRHQDGVGAEADEAAGPRGRRRAGRRGACPSRVRSGRPREVGGGGDPVHDLGHGVAAGGEPVVLEGVRGVEVHERQPRPVHAARRSPGARDPPTRSSSGRATTGW